MDMKRREFLKFAGAASAALIPGADALASKDGGADFGEMYGVLVDTTVCTGCRKCEFACDRQNELTGNDLRWFEGLSFSEYRRMNHEQFTVVNQFPAPNAPEGRAFIKNQCMHCNHPACVSACIVGALEKTDIGAVIYDAWKCIGCRYCMVACPFQVPAYEYEEALKPRVMKCTFCHERLLQGEKPACVGMCPVETLTFGKRKDLVELAHSKIIRNRDRYVDHVYGEYEAGGTSWMYLTSVDIAVTGLVHMPYDAFPERTEQIQHGIFKSFLPPVMLYGLLGLIMHSARQSKREDEGKDHE
ncbi:MAG: 4Fe-4S dicluster domain-containing protein [Candidatus Eisenbacteria bacterium]